EGRPTLAPFRLLSDLPRKAQKDSSVPLCDPLRPLRLCGEVRLRFGSPCLRGEDLHVFGRDRAKRPAGVVREDRPQRRDRAELAVRACLVAPGEESLLLSG